MFKHITAILVLFSLVILSSCEDDPVEPSGEHFEATGFVLLKNDSIVFKVLNNEVDESISDKLYLSLSEGEEDYDIQFLDENGNNIGVPEDEHEDENNNALKKSNKTMHDDSPLEVEVEDESIVVITTSEWEMTFTPYKVGETRFRVKIMHGDHPDFTSPFAPVEVK